MKTNEAIISDVNARHLRRRIRKMNASLMESFVKLYTHSYEENVAFFSLFLVFFGLLFFFSLLFFFFRLRILARSVCVIALCFLAARAESVRFLLDVNTPVGVSDYQGEKAVTWIFFNMSHLVR